MDRQSNTQSEPCCFRLKATNHELEQMISDLDEVLKNQGIESYYLDQNGRFIRPGSSDLSPLHDEEEFRSRIIKSDMRIFDHLMERARSCTSTVRCTLKMQSSKHVFQRVTLHLKKKKFVQSNDCFFHLTVIPMTRNRSNASKIATERLHLQFQSVILESIGEAVIVTDTQGKILYWNKAAERIYGWTRVEALGRNIIDILAVEENFDQAKEIMKSLQEGNVWSGEFKTKHKDGHTFIAGVTDTSLRDENGNIAMIIGVSSDLTEKKQLEQQRLELQEVIFRQVALTADINKARAESESHFKSQFIAHMNHEIRTPLTIMKGYTDLLARSIKGTQYNSWIETIFQACSQLERLVNDILDISKIEAGKMEAELQQIPLRPLLEELHQLFSLKALEKHIHISFTLEESAPRYITTDPLRLKQILINLINNAIKYTEHGTITIRVRRTSSELGKKQDFLTFEVEDTGIGIAPEHQESIFQAFQQGDPMQAKKRGGTGMGLTLSLALARLLGGEVSLARSEVGKGSLFLLTIDPTPRLITNLLIHAQPSTFRNCVSTDAKSGQSLDLKGVKILIVDDADDIRFLLAHYFIAEEAQVHQASNGREAIEYAQRQDFDVMLMDLQMPDMDGKSALLQIRASGFRKPIIAVSAHTLPEEREACLKIGFDDYVPKPIDFLKLRNVIVGSLNTYAH